MNQQIEEKNNSLYTELYIEQTLKNLQRIFRQHLIIFDLHLYDTEEKMMNMLKKESGENWNTDYILDLSKNNKIKWVKGVSDTTDYETYQKGMNNRLSEILCTK